MSESMFCSSCGTPLSAGAMFCGKCGNRVEAKAADTPTNDASATTTNAALESGNSAQESPAQESPAQSAKFKKLMLAIWISIGFTLLAGLIQLTDVREYYSTGRMCCILCTLLETGLVSWLAFRVFRRQNWARVTFIAYTILCAVGNGTSLFTGAFESGLVLTLNLISAAVGVYGAVALCGREIKSSFKPIKKGVRNAVLYWCALLVVLVLGLVGSVVYQNGDTDVVLTNYVDAIAAGSEEARSDLSDMFMSEDESLTEEQVSAMIDQLVVNVTGESAVDTKKTETRPRKTPKRTNSSKSSLFKDLLGDKDVVKKLICVVIAGITSIGAWLKNKLGAIFGKA